MSQTLFKLSDDIQYLEFLLNDDELTDEQRQNLVDCWLEAQGDAELKLDNYAALIQELDARSTARAIEARRLVALANADAAKMDNLLARLKLYFQRHELKTFETPRYKLTLAGHGGKVPLIVPEEWENDPAAAPEAFQRRVIQLDKDAIREAIRNDQETHGARLGERGSSIRIR